MRGPLLTVNIVNIGKDEGENREEVEVDSGRVRFTPRLSFVPGG